MQNLLAVEESDELIASILRSNSCSAEEQEATKSKPDGKWKWRKYGTKVAVYILRSLQPLSLILLLLQRLRKGDLNTVRDYYKCTVPSCPAKKFVDNVAGQLPSTKVKSLR